MVFIVNLVKYGIIIACGLILIVCTIFLFWSFTAEPGASFIGDYSVTIVIIFLSVIVSALFGTAILISAHDSLLKISEHMERLAHTSELIAMRSATYGDEGTRESALNE